MRKRRPPSGREECVAGDWSCTLERDDIEVDSTDLRVRYSPVGKGVRATLVRRRRGHFALRARYLFTPDKVKAVLTDEVADALPSFVRLVALDSYSGDSRSFRSDALRIACRGIITEPHDIEALLAAGVTVAARLQELGFAVPRPAPSNPIR